ncbi:MAG TPA: baseplate J/gp47 family protein [Candidatus Dormibacteraeota bacterium]|nr:baseplate J/gp47 family protein [Candidatus Dormibacteraeota bacterium]
MSGFGVTDEGFIPKGVTDILNDGMTRARQMFDNVDLSATSPLRKILEAVATEANETWKAMEAQYYANFISTAEGPSLDLLGEDIGVARENLRATGSLQLTLANGQPARSYLLPDGTLFETSAVAPATRIHFRTLQPVILTAANAQQMVAAEAMERGPAGNVAAAQVTVLNADHARFYLDLGAATVTPTNPAPFSGGELMESDDDYRARLLGYPRSLWTLERVQAVVRDVDGVRDCRVFDPLGGVDVGQSYFNTFAFGQRVFSTDRRLGTPYYFDIVVAGEPGWPWRTQSGIAGLYERVVQAMKEVRPVSIFPNVIAANQVEIGTRATLLVEAGHDRNAIEAHILAGVHQYVSNLRLGRDVLHSDVLVLARTAPGVVDVQDLHLRRCPPVFSEISFGDAVFRQTVEAAVGENISLAADEVAYFRIDSKLIDIKVVDR